MKYDPNWASRAETHEALMSRVQSGHRVFIHGASATPTPLIDALAKRTDLEDVETYHLHLSGPVAISDASVAGRVHPNALFIGPSMRKPVEEGRADFIPIFLSDIPNLFTSKRVPLDVALIQLSMPDEHGNCTLGPSVDTAKAAADSARIVLAEINQQMPRTHGNSVVPLSRVTAFTLTDRPLHEAPPAEQGAVEDRIGEIIADLVEDGSTLQMGIGAIPDAVLRRLGNKVDLGIHTEMFSDGLIPLVEGGVITNRLKQVHRGRIVTSFVSGTKKLFDFVHDNLLVEFHPCDRTNDTSIIRQNPKVVAINSAIEVDVTGQVCADSMGFRMFSGIGGQMDFIRGAALSEGGRPIIALPATAANGKVSRISASLKPGAGVVTTRGHVHWVVTEYGAVDLHGRSLKQRAEALISIAHPDFRAELTREVANVRHFPMGA
jgi:4-hydroxybutyrate CoA-transferase